MINSVLSGDSAIDVGALLAASGAQGAGEAMESAPQASAETAMAAVSAMSAAERDKMLSQIDERLFSILPESTLEQAAITAVQKEYTALGIDLSAMQSRSIWSNGGMMLLIALIGAGAAVAVGYFGSVTAARLGRDLRGEIFHKVIHFGQQEMDGFSTASLITRSTNDCLLYTSRCV